MNSTKIIALSLGLLFFTSNSQASSSSSDGYKETNNTKTFDIFKGSNGWLRIADDKNDTSYGGQAYDTEYLFMRYNSNNTLSIGLQTGFDLSDGQNNGINGGDLALAFRNEDGYLIGNQASTNHGGEHHNQDSKGHDGSNSSNHDNSSSSSHDNSNSSNHDNSSSSSHDNSNSSNHDNSSSSSHDNSNSSNHDNSGSSSHDDHQSTTAYNYAVDFGFLGASEGLYKVDGWNTETSYRDLENNGVYEANSSVRVGDLSQNDLEDGSENGYKSYYRIVTFDLNDIDNLSTSFTVDVFWTMSCGNDQIYGSSSTLTHNSTNPVPEPSIIALIGIGSISIFASGLRRKRLSK